MNMKTVLLAVAAIALQLGAATLGVHAQQVPHQVVLEAELASFSSPMVTKFLQGQNVVGTEVTEAGFCGSTLSAVQQCPNMAGTNSDPNAITNNAGTIDFVVDIPAPNYYMLDVVAFAPNPTANSVYIRIDNGAWSPWDMELSTSLSSQQHYVKSSPYNHRIPSDFECLFLSQGQHRISVRWQELGVFIDKLILSTKLPDLKVFNVTGCEYGAAEECPTVGGLVLSFVGEAACPDLQITMGGTPCLGVQFNPILANQFFQCVLPEGTGSELDIVFTSAGRSAVLEEALEYHAPEVAKIVGCQHDNEVLGSTSGCNEGTVITIEGEQFGRDGASVTVGDVPCENVAHDPEAPFEKLTCKLGKAVHHANLALIVTQRSLPGGVDLTVTYFGIAFKPSIMNYIWIAVAAGALLLVAIVYLVARRVSQIIGNRKQKMQLMGQEPWRPAIERANPKSGIKSMEIVTCKNAPAHAFYLPSHVNPLDLDGFAEVAHVSRLPALENLLGVAFSRSTPTALVTATATGDLSVREFLAEHRNGKVDIPEALSWIQDIAMAAALCYSRPKPIFELMMLSLDTVHIRLNSQRAKRSVAVLPGLELGKAFQKSIKKGSTNHEAKHVKDFGMFCAQLLCVDFVTSRTPAASSRAATSRSQTQRTQDTGGITSSIGHSSMYKYEGMVHDLRFLDNVPPAVMDMVHQAVNKSAHIKFGIMATLMESVAREVTVKKLVDERTAELTAAYERSDQLLGNMIPREFLPMVKAGTPIAAKIYRDTTVFFCDVEGFTTSSSLLEPEKVVKALEQLMNKLDVLALKYGVHRVNLIGDAYFAISGAPTPAKDHALRVALFSFDAIAAANTIMLGDKPMSIRVGFHSGSVAGGIQGLQVPRFDVFGDTVNVASRMESTGIVNRVQITAAAKAMLEVQSPGTFKFEERSNVDVKGKGKMTTYLVSKSK